MPEEIEKQTITDEQILEAMRKFVKYKVVAEDKQIFERHCLLKTGNLNSVILFGVKKLQTPDLENILNRHTEHKVSTGIIFAKSFNTKQMKYNGWYAKRKKSINTDFGWKQIIELSVAEKYLLDNIGNPLNYFDYRNLSIDAHKFARLTHYQISRLHKNTGIKKDTRAFSEKNKDDCYLRDLKSELREKYPNEEISGFVQIKPRKRFREICLLLNAREQNRTYSHDKKFQERLDEQKGPDIDIFQVQPFKKSGICYLRLLPYINKQSKLYSFTAHNEQRQLFK